MSTGRVEAAGLARLELVVDMDSQLQLEDLEQPEYVLGADGERAGRAPSSGAAPRRGVVRRSTPRTSPYKRARAARLIREGESYAQTGREVGVDKRTIARWMKDESFLGMVQA